MFVDVVFIVSVDIEDETIAGIDVEGIPERISDDELFVQSLMCVTVIPDDEITAAFKHIISPPASASWRR